MGKRPKNGPRWQKKFVSQKKKLQLISQEPYIIWLSFMVHLCKMMISLAGFFFHFFKILILWVIKGGGVKGQKMVQNEKKICLLRSISPESYIWFLFMVLMCKMLTSRSFFHFFKILIFLVVRGVKGQKIVQNDKKIMSVALDISGTIDHMIVICCTQV